MRASIGKRVRRLALVLLVAMGLLRIGPIGDTGTAVARTRSLVEAGDPDGSGKPSTGPMGASVILSPNLSPSLTTSSQVGLWRLSPRDILAFWVWSHVFAIRK